MAYTCTILYVVLRCLLEHPLFKHGVPPLTKSKVPGGLQIAWATCHITEARQEEVAAQAPVDRRRLPFGGYHWYPKRLANQDVSGYHHEITMILKERAIKLHRFESEIGKRLLSSGCCCGIQFHFRVLVTISDSSHIRTHRSTGQFFYQPSNIWGKWRDLKTQKPAKFLVFRRNSFRGPLFFITFEKRSFDQSGWGGIHSPKLWQNLVNSLDVHAHCKWLSETHWSLH